MLFFRRDDNKLKCLRNSLFASRRSQSRLYFDGDECCDYLPPGALRATVRCFDNECVLLGGSTPVCLENRDDENLRNSVIEDRLFKSSRWIDGGDALPIAIQNCAAMCVADGSFHPTHMIGTTGFVFDDGSYNAIGVGGSRVPGPPACHCSYRSELFGIYLVMLIFQRTCNKFQIQKDRITIGCDNIGALDKGLGTQFFPSVQHKHYDIIWAIHSIRNEFPIEIAFLHVKGHQDDEKNYQTLDRWGQLNVLADKEAKRQLSWYINNPDYDRDIPLITPHWTVSIDGDIVTNNIKQSLRDYIHAKNMKSFLCRKGTVSYATYDLVDWDSNGKALNSMTFGERIWVTKFVSGFNGCVKMMLRCKQWESDTCPRCGDCIENNWHVLWCAETQVRAQHYQLTCNIDTWLKENDTHPALHRLIITIFQQGDTTSFSCCARGNFDPQIIELAKMQDQIGVRNVFEGRLSKRWSIVQESRLRMNVRSSCRSGASWTAGLIRRIYRWGQAQ